VVGWAQTRGLAGLSVEGLGRLTLGLPAVRMFGLA
jgi:hypothetical protein